MSNHSLDRVLAKGLLWTSGAKLAVQITSWIGFLVLARLLSREDFGIVGTFAVVSGFVALIAEFGLGSAILAQKDLDESTVRQAFSGSLLLGLVSATLCWLAAPFASKFLDAEGFDRALVGLGISIGIAIAGAVPLAVLRRDLRFRASSVLDSMKSLLQSLVAIVLAWRGFGFWSLIGAEIAANFFNLIALIFLTRTKPAFPHFRELRRIARVSRDVLVSRIAWYSYTNADFALVAKRSGPAAVGDYATGWNLVNLPAEKIGAIIWSVMPSIFSKAQDDKSRIARYVLLLVEALVGILLPASLGLALVAPDLVPILLGEKWKSAVPIVQALAAFAVVKTIAPLAGQVLVYTGRSDLARNQSIWGLLLMLPAFFIGSHWGPLGVALAWSVVFPPFAMYQLNVALRTVELSLINVWQKIRVYVFASAAMAVCVLGAQFLMTDTTQQQPMLRLLLSVFVGIISYAVLLRTFAAPRVRLLLHSVSELKAGKA